MFRCGGLAGCCTADRAVLVIIGRRADCTIDVLVSVDTISSTNWAVCLVACCVGNSVLVLACGSIDMIHGFVSRLLLAGCGCCCCLFSLLLGRLESSFLLGLLLAGLFFCSFLCGLAAGFNLFALLL